MKADPNAADKDGDTPCHVACRRGDECTPALDALLALGADPTVIDKHGRTPCMYAALNSGSVPCLRALAAGGPGGALVGDAVNAVDMHYDMTALGLALEWNHAEFAAVLRDELGGKRAADVKAEEEARATAAAEKFARENTEAARAAATWATHGAAVAASRATLDAPDPAAAMRGDLGALGAAWQRKREALLRGDGGAALRAMSEEEAQVLLGTASEAGDVEGLSLIHI